MKRFFIFCLSLLSFTCLFAQSTQWHWSCLVNKLSNEDSAFLVDTESKIWKASADDSVKLPTFEGGRSGGTYSIGSSKFSTKRMFGDSLPLKRLTDYAELDLAWNHTADTCYVLSYSPMLWRDRQRYGSFGPITRDTIVWLRVPTASYFPLLKEQEYRRLFNFQVDVLSSHFGCKRNGDTLSRIVPFTIDSNEYLPQASYRVILDKIMNGMLTWKFSSYDDPICSIRLSGVQCERKVTHWDSTFKVEDPNAPGTYFLVPTKFEAQPISFLVNESWIPGVQVEALKRTRIPKPSVIYRRVVVSYGVRFSSGDYVWFKADEIHKYLRMPLIDFSAYEQCFRAERFERMKIFTY